MRYYTRNSTIAKLKAFGYTAAVVLLIVGVLPMILGSCTVDERTAKRILGAQGFTDVKLTGYSIFGCSKDQQRRSGFDAKDVRGNEISGVLCQDLFGSTSVRVY